MLWVQQNAQMKYTRHCIEMYVCIYNTYLITYIRTECGNDVDRDDWKQQETEGCEAGL